MKLKAVTIVKNNKKETFDFADYDLTKNEAAFSSKIKFIAIIIEYIFF